MDSVALRVFENFETLFGPAKPEDLAAIEAKYGVTLAHGVKQFYLELGWGAVFAAPVPSGDVEVLPEYIMLDAPEAILDNCYAKVPAGFIAIGSNGSGEMILVHPNGECGLLPFVSDYATDYIRVASSFEEFLEKAERGVWFG